MSRLPHHATRTLPELDLFANLPTSRERVEFVYSLLPPDATSLDRLWPIRIPQKDSRQVYTRIIKRGKSYPVVLGSTIQKSPT